MRKARLSEVVTCKDRDQSVVLIELRAPQAEERKTDQGSKRELTESHRHCQALQALECNLRCRNELAEGQRDAAYAFEALCSCVRRVTEQKEEREKTMRSDCKR